MPDFVFGLRLYTVFMWHFVISTRLNYEFKWNFVNHLRGSCGERARKCLYAILYLAWLSFIIYRFHDFNSVLIAARHSIPNYTKTKRTIFPKSSVFHTLSCVWNAIRVRSRYFIYYRFQSKPNPYVQLVIFYIYNIFITK